MILSLSCIKNRVNNMTFLARKRQFVLQALEAALPPTVSDFMHLLSAHANAGQENSFAACQLLQLAATCVVTYNPSSQLVVLCIY